MEYTDITFEIFNSCAGSCTGCMLSSNERTNFNLPNINDILLGLKKISEYGKSQNIHYRPVFSFGDFPKIPIHEQNLIIDKCIELNLGFGLTLTLVDEQYDYLPILKNIYLKNPQAVFDLTIDPVRLKNPKFFKYRNNILELLSFKPKVHLQVLLSSYIMEQFTATELNQLLSSLTDYEPFFLGFSPTLTNIESHKFYQYSFVDAIKYSKDFYQASDKQKNFLNKEILRNKNTGEYINFVQSIFHIDYNLNVYPQIYTIFGDLIQDKRNKLTPLGNLKQNNLFEILHSTKVIKLNIKNNILLDTSNYNCEQCEFSSACKYNGIGILNNLYDKYSNRNGLCYGPINLNIK